MIETLNRWAGVWLEAMTAVLWQSTLLIAIAAAAAWYLRRSSPTVRYWLWQIVAVKLLVMPFWTFAVPLPTWAKAQPTAQSPAESIASEPDAGVALPIVQTMPLSSDRGTLEDSPSAAFWKDLLASATWQAWCFAAWLAAVLWQCVRLAVQRRRLAVLLRRGQPADRVVADLVDELSRQTGLRRTPTLISVDGDCPIFVCGLRHPKLVLPNRLMASLGPTERQQIILHELAHIRRRDLYWGWLVEIARLVYWFHPLVYWVAHQLRLERELACDQWAMAYSGHPPADYAQTLIHVVSQGPEPAIASSAVLSAGLSGNQASPKSLGTADK